MFKDLENLAEDFPELHAAEHVGTDLVDALRVARQRLTGDEEVIKLRRHLERIKSAFTEGLEPLPGEANDNTPSPAGDKELQQ
jgi:hypothetical protein